MKEGGVRVSIARMLLRYAVVPVVAGLVFAGYLRGATENRGMPGEYGVYVKTSKKLVRILPNIVLEEKGILYVEGNNPPRFSLHDIGYFVFAGRHEMKYLTLNNLVFMSQSSLGRGRFMIGKEVGIEVKKKNDTFYTVRPKRLFGRGYYCLWINDSAWDFIVE